MIVASDNIDEVISIIRGSENPDVAKSNLIERFKLSEIQAKAIVEMRLRQLTGLEQDKLRSEFETLQKTIADLKEILDKNSNHYDLLGEVVKDSVIIDGEPTLQVDKLREYNKSWLIKYMVN